MADQAKTKSMAMLEFLQLPQEIILYVIESYLHHGDLENFALSSKAMFELSKPTRAKHLRAKSQFHTFSGGKRYPRGKEEIHPVSVMRQLVEGNYWRDYCKVFQIHSVSKNGLLASWKPILEERMEKVFLEIEPKICALGDQLPDELQLDYSGHVARLRYGHSHLVYWLPMAMLPNIQTLELNDCSDFIYSLRPILKMFAKSDDGPQTNLGFLPRLKEVKVTQYKPKIGAGLEILGIFATVPTVRRLYGSNVHVSQSGNLRSDKLNWFPNENSTNVEEIQLVGGSIEAEGLTQLLKGVRALRVFSYPTTTMDA